MNREELSKYIEHEYGIKGDYPWKRYPDYAAFRHQDNQKWFALLMRIKGSYVGRDAEEMVDVVDIKCQKGEADFLQSMPGVYPAYHMNRDNWVMLSIDEIDPVTFKNLLERSYTLTRSASSKIYEAVRKIPRGRVATYGQVAAMAGNPRMSRAVGNALHKNPDPEGIPCYRVVNSQGKLADAFAFGGAGIQKRRLEADGIEVKDNKVDLAKYGIVLSDNFDEY